LEGKKKKLKKKERKKEEEKKEEEEGKKKRVYKDQIAEDLPLTFSSSLSDFQVVSIVQCH
jgi:hypothetical protein